VTGALDRGLLIVAAAAWVSAVVAGLLLLVRHRRAGLSLAPLWFDGARWFRRDTFAPEAAGLHRVFVAAAVVFALALVAVALRTLAG
jgi:hypothetical protein